MREHELTKFFIHYISLFEEIIENIKDREKSFAEMFHRMFRIYIQDILEMIPERISKQV